jgi:hypothetical protein
VTVTVNATNDAPVNSVPGAQTGDEDTALVFSGANGNEISTSDLDAGSNPVKVTLEATNGTLTLSVTGGLNFTAGDGTNDTRMSFTGLTADVNAAVNGLSFNPDSNYNGSSSTLSFTTDDQGKSGSGSAKSDTDTVNISVIGVNDPPSFTKGANQSVQEDAGAQSIPNWATGISAGPADESAQNVSFIVTNDNNSLFSAQPAVTAGGTLTYTPAADANGTATVDVKIQDNGGTANGGVDESAVQTFNITVSSINDAPGFQLQANPDQTVAEDSGPQDVTGFVTSFSAGPSNESDETVSSYLLSNDNNGLFTSGGQPSIDNNGKLTYTPAADANGSATVSVRAQDDGGSANGGVDTSAPQSFSISVNAINDAPTVTNIADQTTNEDTATLAIAFTVGDVETSAASLTVSGSSSNTTLVPNGNITLDGSGANRTVMVTPERDRSGTATITVSVSDDSAATTSDTFVLTVNAINDGPAIDSVTDSGPVNEGSAATITVAATDAEGDALSYEFDCNNDGVHEIASQPADNAQCTFNDDGIRRVNARVTDAGSGGTDTDFTDVTVNNVAPSANFNAPNSVNEGDSFNLSLASPSDPSSADTAAGFEYAFDCDLDDPEADYADGFGSSNSADCSTNDNGTRNIGAKLRDKDGSVSTYEENVTINNVDPTISLVTNDGSVNEGAAATIAVTASDLVGANDPLYYSFDCNGNGVYNDTGNVGPQSANSAQCSFANDGNYTVSVRVTDGDGGQDTDSTQVTVNNVAPTVTLSGPALVDESATAERLYEFTVTDPGPGDEGAQIQRSCGDNGQEVTGSYQYDPQSSQGSFRCLFPDGQTTSSVRVSATDDDGASDADSEKVIIVSVSNVAPNVIAAANQNSDEGENKSFNLGSFTDPGPDGPWQVTVDWGDSSADGPFVANTSGSLGSRTHTYADNGNYTVTVTVAEAGNDTTPSDSKTFQVVVANVAPTTTLSATNELDVTEGTTTTYTYTVSDPGDDTVQAVSTGCGANGTRVSDVANSFDCYFPNGPATTGVTARATDSDGAIDTDNQLVEVDVANVAPTISNITDHTTNEDTATGAIAFTVGDAGTPTGSLTVSGTSANTALVPNGNIAFGGSGTNRTLTVTPAANQTGTATITVGVSDGTASAARTFVLTVTPVNDAPVAHSDSYTTAEDTPLTVNDAAGVLGDDLDVDGDNLTAAVVDGPAHGQLSLASSGAFTFTPEANYNGTDSFTYRANDAVVNSGLATVTLNVSPVNDAPAILPAIADRTIAEDTDTGVIPFTVSDVDNAVGDLVVSGGSSNTALVPNGNILFGGSGANPTVKVTPAPERSGTAMITLSVSDGVASATDSFVLTVSPVAPQAITAKPSGQRVSPKAKVTVTFSERLDPGTLTPSTFTLKKGKQKVPAKVTYNEVTKTVTLTPTRKLSSGARYTAIMLGGPLGAKDIGGDMLAANKQWKFKVR